MNYTAYCFDAFGTLFNVSWDGIKVTEIEEHKLKSVISTWRIKQLTATWLMNSMGVYKPFDQVSGEALEKSFAIHEVDSPKLFQEILGQVLRPELFADVSESLHSLKEAGHQVGILSNGTSEMLEEVSRISGVSEWLDQLISVDELEVFKPAPEVYALAVQKMEVDTDDFLFVSSNQWDVIGAMYAGLQTAWLNRTGVIWESIDIQPQMTLSSMEELVHSITESEQ